MVVSLYTVCERMKWPEALSCDGTVQRWLGVGRLKSGGLG